MRGPFLSHLSVLCLLASACGDSSDSPTDGTDDDGSCVLEATLSLEDSKAFFPFRPGNRWAYRGSIDRAGGSTEYATELIALELENRGNTTVMPLRVTNPRDSREPGTNYFSLSDSGMTNEGNDVADDRLTPEVVPYPEVTFPVRLCSTFEQFNVTIDSGSDVDGDQRNEPVTVVSRVWLRRLEDAETPIGTFNETLRLERSTTTTATATRTGERAEVTERSVEWFAKDVGPVKRTLTTEMETVEEALYGFGVDGAGRGANLLEPLALGVASAGSDQTSPGRPAVASDGNRFLVVFVNAASASLDAVILSNTGAVESTLSLGEEGTTPAAAYDGQNYLVAFRSDAGIEAVRLSPEGTKLGAKLTIATNGAGNVVEPDIAFGGGAFLVVYGRYTGTEWNLHGTRVSSEGATEAEFVLSDAPRDQRAPALSFGGAGFLAAWQDARNDADIARNTDIYAARIGPDGRVIDTTAIAVSAGAAPETDVDVASHSEHFVLAWYASRNPSFIGDGEIRGARVGADGTLLDGAATAGGFAVNTTERSKGHPRVARFGDGALVVWGSQDFSTTAAGILGARIDASGMLLDGSAADEGLWLSRVPSPSIATRFVLPELASLGDRLLLAFIDNVETSGQTKSVQASLLYPW